jgi:hypothetical protein
VLAFAGNNQDALRKINDQYLVCRGNQRNLKGFATSLVSGTQKDEIDARIYRKN